MYKVLGIWKGYYRVKKIHYFHAWNREPRQEIINIWNITDTRNSTTVYTKSFNSQWRAHLSIPLITGRGTGTETCGIGSVFPPDGSAGLIWISTWTVYWYFIYFKRLTDGVCNFLFAFTDGERDGLCLPAVSGHWLPCTGCYQYLLIIFNLAGWINFRKLISILYLFVCLFNQLMFYCQYSHYTTWSSGITHYVSKYHSKSLFNAHWNLFWLKTGNFSRVPWKFCKKFEQHLWIH